MRPPHLRTIVALLCVVVFFSVLGMMRSSSWRPFSALLFSDVVQQHPNAAAILYLSSRGVVQGYADGAFRPERVVTRAELVKVLAALSLPRDAINTCPSLLSDVGLSDVRSSDWFFPFVCAAKKFGYVTGYSDGTFRPSTVVNFAEASKLIASYFRFPAATDFDPIWYKPSVRELADRKAIPPSIKGVTAPLTRGEMAEILYRLSEGITSKDSLTYEEVVLPSSIVAHPAAQPSEKSQAQQLFLLLNTERARRGVLALKYNALLERTAQEHAVDMASQGYYGHDSADGQNSEDRMRGAGYISCPDCAQWTYRTGETLAWVETAAGALKSWINSDTHRAIIFSPDFVDVGIGVSGDKWVANFGVIYSY